LAREEEKHMVESEWNDREEEQNDKLTARGEYKIQ